VGAGCAFVEVQLHLGALLGRELSVHVGVEEGLLELAALLPHARLLNSRTSPLLFHLDPHAQLHRLLALDDAGLDRVAEQVLLEQLAAPVEAAHDRAHRAVEDLAISL